MTLGLPRSLSCLPAALLAPLEAPVLHAYSESQQNPPDILGWCPSLLSGAVIKC